MLSHLPADKAEAASALLRDQEQKMKDLAAQNAMLQASLAKAKDAADLEAENAALRQQVRGSSEPGFQSSETC